MRCPPAGAKRRLASRLPSQAASLWRRGDCPLRLTVLQMSTPCADFCTGRELMESCSNGIIRPNNELSCTTLVQILYACKRSPAISQGNAAGGAHRGVLDFFADIPLKMQGTDLFRS